MKLKRKIRLLKKYLTDADYRFYAKARMGKYDHLPDDEYLRRMFRAKMGTELNLDHPRTFNEKLQWLKLHNHRPECTMMVDKYEAKEYVAGIIGEEHIIPTLGIWDRFDEIDFDALPDRFVLKCTHDSGGLVICRDKAVLDMDKARKKIEKSLAYDFFSLGREWPYKHVKRRILAEQYMEDSAGKGDLTDYKLHFFSGECKAVMIGQNRFGANGLDNDYYTPEWEHFDFTRGNSHNAEKLSPRPPEMDEMLRLGKMLAKDEPFVRIDFYVINGKIYFGEITFYPASGFNAFHPEKWDHIFGEWIKIPVDEQ